MKRIAWLLVAVLLICTVTLGVQASRATPSTQASTNHLVVGTWGFGGDSLRLYTFFADGNVLVTDDTGGIYQGTWEALSENVVNTHLVMVVPTAGVVGQGSSGAMVVTDDGRLYADPTGVPAGRITPDPKAAEKIDLDSPEIQKLLEGEGS